jgi:hypothetical protein
VTGREYSELVARYVLFNYERRGIRIYREVPIGKSIIGKNRKLDLLVLDETSRDGFALECKFQGSQGTADEKIPYALDDLRAMRMAGGLVYAGEGFSTGILHLLRASDMAAYCLPDAETLAPGPSTVELDHFLAIHFRWWDLLVDERRRVHLVSDPSRAGRASR